MLKLFYFLLCEMIKQLTSLYEVKFILSQSNHVYQFITHHIILIDLNFFKFYKGCFISFKKCFTIKERKTFNYMYNIKM